MIARTRDADALVVSSWPVTRGVMSALEGLKVVVRTGVGYDVIDVPAATELGVIVVNIPDLWIREVANHALALLLAWNRGVVIMDRQVHAGGWSGKVPGSHTGALHGETVGIVGLGNIGSAFARRVAALETKVIACDPYVDDKRFAALDVERVSLETLAERSDYVSVHTLLNAETRHLIGEAFFRRMKPTTILINTSRGPVVDEQALARALRDKRLAGAALDVWEEEPVTAANPLLKMDNVIATPHVAYFSSAAVAQIPRRCGEEVAWVLTGQRPLNVVNPEIYAPCAAVDDGDSSPSQIEPPNALVGPDRLAGALVPVLAQLEHVGVVRDLQRLGRVLLDHQDRLSEPPQALDDAEDFLEHERRQAQGGLVEQDQPRLEEQGPRHLEHLLLPAGEVACALPLRLAESGERLVDSLYLPIELGRPRASVGPQQEVFLDGHQRKDVPPLRDVRHAAAQEIGGRSVRDVLAVQEHTALPGGQEAEDRLEHGRFPRAVRADDRDHLTALDREGHALQDLELAVPGMEVADFEEGHRHLPK